MICIPFSLNAKEYNIFVALDDSNLIRVRHYDPAQLDVVSMGPAFRHKRLVKVIIGYADTADVQKITALINDGKPAEALEYLSRGFAFRPDQGDYDGPPMSLRTDPKDPKH